MRDERREPRRTGNRLPPAIPARAGPSRDAGCASAAARAAQDWNPAPSGPPGQGPGHRGTRDARPQRREPRRTGNRLPPAIPARAGPSRDAGCASAAARAAQDWKPAPSGHPGQRRAIAGRGMRVRSGAIAGRGMRVRSGASRAGLETGSLRPSRPRPGHRGTRDARPQRRHRGTRDSRPQRREPRRTGNRLPPANPATGRDGGGRGIRTPGTLSGSAVFKTAAIDRSAIPPATCRCARSTDRAAVDYRTPADHLEAHVGAQRLGHDDGAVGLLVVLEDGNQRAADGEARAVQRVRRARLLRALAAGTGCRRAAPGTPRCCCRTRSRDTCSAPAARPRCRRSWPTAKPMSPVHSSTCGRAARAAAARARRRRSAPRARRTTARARVNFTSSTLSNWCCRIRPRTSVP